MMNGKLPKQKMQATEVIALRKCVECLHFANADVRFASARNPTRGKSYVAARALLDYLGGKKRGYRLMRAVDQHNVPHYWVANSNDAILDPTKAQYEVMGEFPPYTTGISVSYRPKNKHRTLLAAMRRLKVA